MISGTDHCGQVTHLRKPKDKFEKAEYVKVSRKVSFQKSTVKFRKSGFEIRPPYDSLVMSN